MNEVVTHSEPLPSPIQIVVLVLAVVVGLAHLVLVVYASAKAWWKLPGPKALLWTLLCLFLPVPLVGPLVLLHLVRRA